MADIFAIVGRGGRIATSEDGITWTGRPSSTTNHLWNVETNGSRWLVGEESKQMLRSPDGIHAWTPFVAEEFDLSAFAWNGSVWCAVSASENEIYTSPDTITWTARSSGVANANADWDDICWDSQNGQFVAVGSDFSGNSYVITSPNGTTWTTRSAPSSFEPVCVAANSGTIVIGNGAVIGSSPYHRVAYSTDAGQTWTKVSTLFTDQVDEPVFAEVVNSLFIIGGTGGMVATSPDGITWTTRTPAIGAGTVFGASYGAGLYVVVGSITGAFTYGAIFTSPDLVTWTQRTSTTFDDVSPSKFIQGITYGPSNLSWTADSVIRKTISGSFSADAVIAVSNFKANAVIYREMQASFAADAVFAFDISGTTTGRNPHDRAERHFGTMPATLVAYSAIESVEDRLRFVWGRLAAAEADVFRIGALSANAVVAKTMVVLMTANAVISGGTPFVGSWLADAITKRVQLGSFTANADLLRTQTGSAQANAVMRVLASASFAADAYIFSGVIGSFTSNAILFRTITGSLTADAVITTGVESGLLGDHILGQHKLGGE